MIPLSRAIYEGASVTKKCIGNYFELRDGKTFTLSGEIPLYGLVERTWPVARLLVSFPCDCVKLGCKRQVRSIIIHLNDEHDWSRERIADWVVTIERKEDAKCT